MPCTWTFHNVLSFVPYLEDNFKNSYMTIFFLEQFLMKIFSQHCSVYILLKIFMTCCVPRQRLLIKNFSFFDHDLKYIEMERELQNFSKDVLPKWCFAQISWYCITINHHYLYLVGGGWSFHVIAVNPLHSEHSDCGVEPQMRGQTCLLPLRVNANHLPRLRGLTRLLCSSKFVGFDGLRPCMRGLTPLLFCV